MSDGVQGGLEDEARAWAEEHADAAPTPAAPPPGEAAAPPTAAAAVPAPEKPAEPSEGTVALAAQLSALGWGIVDTFVPKFVGKRMALTPDEMKRLVELTTPVVAKRLPEADGELSDEELLLFGVGLTYAPKYFTPEPAAPATPAGGSGPAAGNSGTPTDASVDGKKVDAQVLQ